MIKVECEIRAKDDEARPVTIRVRSTGAAKHGLVEIEIDGKAPLTLYGNDLVAALKNALNTNFVKDH